MNLKKKREHVMNDADIAEQRTANCPAVLQASREAREFLEKHPFPPELWNRRPVQLPGAEEFE